MNTNQYLLTWTDTRPCAQCHRTTRGSVGQAGIYWPSLCQHCKDEADRLSQCQLQGLALACSAFSRGLGHLDSEERDIDNAEEQRLRWAGL